MTRKINFFKDSLFRPSRIETSGKREVLTLSDNAQNTYDAVFTSGSFRYDPAGSPLKNTQQLNIDFSKFENHTFFNSAQNKVQTAFEKIINQYPFDGTRSEYEKFFDNINGFEKYVFDRFPKHSGYLIFDRDGSNPGTFLEVNDKKRINEKDDKKDSYDLYPLSIKNKPFSIEMSLFVPSGTVNYNEIVAQRIQDGYGFTLALSDSSGLDSPHGKTDLVFIVSDKNKAQIVTQTIDKGKFNHIAAVYDLGGLSNLSLTIDGDNTKYSPGSIFLDELDFEKSSFYIGTGSNHVYDTVKNRHFEPVQTLSGAIDEFRFFNSSRTIDDTKKYKDREIFAQKDLQLYFRFNEPSGTFYYDGTGNENLCLDHSGNGLHTFISNFSMDQRDTSRLSIKALSHEEKSYSPVLFPTYEEVRTLSQDLLTSASLYDINNPNIITNLIPRHYLVEEQYELGQETLQGDIQDPPGYTQDLPGGNKLNQAQLISSVLYMWADTFDEIKMFIDSMSSLLKVDYTSEKSIPDQLLPFLAEYYDLTLPGQFSSANISQYVQGRNLTLEDAASGLSLQEIQNTIWRRILTDLPALKRSKGTRNSIESVLRNIGINPGTTFKIKEYGGKSKREIQNSYEKRTRIKATLDFSGSLSPAGTIDGEGRDNKKPLVTSAYLSGTRVEPGKPNIQGTFLEGVSNSPSDGLFTSGSWNLEAVFKMPSRGDRSDTQSLMRIHTTGSSSGAGNNWLTFNVVAKKPRERTQQTGSVIFYGKPDGSNSREFKIEIPNVNIFDGQKWHVSVGRDTKSSEYFSSSYYLRVGKSRYSKTPLIYTSSYAFHDTDDNTLNTIDSTYNASGSFVCVGSMSMGYDGTSALTFLNHSSNPDASFVNFTGQISNLRFFSKEMSVSETISHIENPESLGVKDPTVNYNFTSAKTGSFERLRFDYSIDQVVTSSNSSGNIEIFDFSQNGLHGLGTGFEPEKGVIKPLRWDFRTISPKLDVRSSDNKVRVRSYKSYDLASREGVGVAPIYNIPYDETPEDDRRVEIEVSSVQALNDDIILLFSSLDFFDNAIGDPELVFSSEYKSLRDMRRIYFNRIEEKMSLMKFFSFFKWFDDTVGDLLVELVPRTSRYLGTNFVIESHSLERPKFVYNYTDMYLGEMERPNPGEIYVQQLIGILKKR